MASPGSYTRSAAWATSSAYRRIPIRWRLAGGSAALTLVILCGFAAIVGVLTTKRIQSEVSTGTSLTVAMTNAEVFPSMVLQMCAIGEESGALDAMLSKVADFFEQEVDEAVESLSSLMEPMIMVVLGTLIGGIVVAMYLPIFKMGQAI